MNLVRFILILMLLLFNDDIFVESIPKKLYNDLLTEDNELILIQQHSSHKKASLQANNTKKIDKISSTSKISSRSNDLIDGKNSNVHSASKLIVNIVYASRQEENTPKSNTVSKRLVYEASSYLNPCDKNVCKANETCVVTSEHEKKPSHKCLPKPLKTKNKIEQTTQKLKHEKTLVVSSNTNKFSLGCNQNKLIELKLKIFSEFESLKSKTNDLKQIELARINLAELHCVESVGFMLNLIDTNNDELLSLEEWSELSYVKNEVCSTDLFNSCAITNKKISYKEFCDCFQGIELKCKFMRNPLNFEVKYGYLEYLNEKFQTRRSNEKNATFTIPRLTAANYIPLCDIRGHFLPHQCDKKVNCWCVNENGEPEMHTVKNIHEDFDVFDCVNDKSESF